jgi:integrase
VEALSKPELIALLTAAKAHKTRDWLMILVAYCHGLRASEVIALQADAVKDGHLTVARLSRATMTQLKLLPTSCPFASSSIFFPTILPTQSKCPELNASILKASSAKSRRIPNLSLTRFF